MHIVISRVPQGNMITQYLDYPSTLSMMPSFLYHMLIQQVLWLTFLWWCLSFSGSIFTIAASNHSSCQAYYRNALTSQQWSNRIPYHWDTDVGHCIARYGITSYNSYILNWIVAVRVMTTAIITLLIVRNTTTERQYQQLSQHMQIKYPRCIASFPMYNLKYL